MNLITLAKRKHLLRLTSIHQFTKTQCCGIREISGLVYFASQSEIAMLAICFRMIQAYPSFPDRIFEHRLTPDLMKWRYFIFSQAGDKRRVRYGEQFKAFIAQKGFGTVIQTGDGQINPNSGNQLIVYLWTINREALIAWFNAEVFKYNAWVMKQHPPIAAAVAPPLDHPGLAPVIQWDGVALLNALDLGQQIAGANIAAAGGIRG